MIKQFYFKQFSLAWVHSLNVKQFYLTQREDLIKCYYFRPEWTWERWHWRCTPHSPKLQYYWSLSDRLFNVISRILVGESYPTAKYQSCILQPQPTGPFFYQYFIMCVWGGTKSAQIYRKDNTDCSHWPLW